MRDERTAGCGTPKTPKSDGDIAAELARMEKSLAVLNETTSLLSERLLCVLRPAASEPTLAPEKSQEQTEPCCELSNMLHQYDRMIYETTGWIRSIIDRCEL